jgi:hypothetical protein
MAEHPEGCRSEIESSQQGERKEEKKRESAYDWFQLVVGEIGYNRHEFLYDLRLWEIHLIVLGYRKRDRLKHQLMAECAFAAIYAMRDPKGKTVADIFPQLFENDEDYDDEPPITDEDAADLQALMARMNHQGETQP